MFDKMIQIMSTGSSLFKRFRSQTTSRIMNIMVKGKGDDDESDEEVKPIDFFSDDDDEKKMDENGGMVKNGKNEKRNEEKRMSKDMPMEMRRPGALRRQPTFLSHADHLSDVHDIEVGWWWW